MTQWEKLVNVETNIVQQATDEDFDRDERRWRRQQRRGPG